MGQKKKKTEAELWKDTDAQIDKKTFCFTLIHEKMEGISEALKKFMLHVALSFWTKVSVLLVNMNISKLHAKRLNVVMVRSKSKIWYLLPDQNFIWLEIICFTCNSKRNVDTNKCEKGRIARCSSEATAKKKKKNLTKKATLFKGWKPSILWSFETNWYKN